MRTKSILVGRQKIVKRSLVVVKESLEVVQVVSGGRREREVEATNG